MRVCCGLTGHLELAKRRDLYGGPVIVGEWEEHVIAASEEAMPFGVMPGMALRQAEHLCPQATFLPPEPQAALQLRELISSALYDLAIELGLRGAGAKRVRLRLLFESAEHEARDSVVRHPLSSAAELFGLMGAWIKEWQPRAPITELWIELPVLEAAGRRQLRLWAGGDGNSEEVTAALERLQERWGDEVVHRPRPALLSSPLPAQRFA